MIRFKKYLLDKEIISEEWEEEVLQELNDKVTKVFEEIEVSSDTEVEDIFKYHYETMPPQLEEQLKEYQDFLQGGKK